MVAFRVYFYCLFVCVQWQVAVYIDPAKLCTSKSCCVHWGQLTVYKRAKMDEYCVHLAKICVHLATNCVHPTSKYQMLCTDHTVYIWPKTVYMPPRTLCTWKFGIPTTTLGLCGMWCLENWCLQCRRQQQGCYSVVPIAPGTTKMPASLAVVGA